MGHALAILVLHTASAAAQRAHQVLLAAHFDEAAKHVHQAAELIANAVGLVIVDKARRNQQQETTS